jgi:hypothetical protein
MGSSRQGLAGPGVLEGPLGALPAAAAPGFSDIFRIWGKTGFPEDPRASLRLRPLAWATFPLPLIVGMLYFHR